MVGDLVYVVRNRLWFGSIQHIKNDETGKLDSFVARFVKYNHYGIEVEDGCVIHFQGKSFKSRKKSKIVKTTREEFIRDSERIYVINDIDYKYSREEVVKRAYSVLDTKFDVYSVLSNNCEHFAYWCITGEKECSQYKAINRGAKVFTYPKKKLVPATYRVKNYTVNMIKSGFNIYK